MHKPNLRALRLVAAVSLAAAAALALGSDVIVQAAGKPAGLTTRVFATGGALGNGVTVSKPDDITQLGGSIFVAWQNGVGSQGEPNGSVQDSSVVQYSWAGQILDSWQLTGRVDGMSADPDNSRILATVNEDGNTSLYIVRPNASPVAQLTHYAYSPDPPVHGGGTDAPHVYRGRIFISASNPSDSTQPALYSVSLSGTTATLAPVFYDDSTARVANTDDAAFGTAVTLALTDPDSNTVVPGSSPRFGGDFLLDSQGDGQLIYARDAGTARQELWVLNLSSVAGLAGASTAVDDTVWATASRGTLFATDGSNTIYAIAGAFEVGTAYSAVTPGNANTPSGMANFLAILNLSTGELTAVPSVTISPKGLLFVAGQG